jgi:hypothetical protein
LETLASRKAAELGGDPEREHRRVSALWRKEIFVHIHRRIVKFQHTGGKVYGGRGVVNIRAIICGISFPLLGLLIIFKENRSNIGEGRCNGEQTRCALVALGESRKVGN